MKTADALSLEPVCSSRKRRGRDRFTWAAMTRLNRPGLPGGSISREDGVCGKATRALARESRARCVHAVALTSATATEVGPNQVAEILGPARVTSKQKLREESLLCFPLALASAPSRIARAPGHPM